MKKHDYKIGELLNAYGGSHTDFQKVRKHKPISAKPMPKSKGSMPIKTITTENISPTTHIQIRTICRDCGNVFITWVNRKYRNKIKRHMKTIPCPNCNSDEANYLHTKINSEGACSSVWSDTIKKHPTNHKIITKMKQKTISCPNCGRSFIYSFRAPSACPACGEPLI